MEECLHRILVAGSPKNLSLLKFKILSIHGPCLSPHHGSCGWLWCVACCCHIPRGFLKSSCSVVGWIGQCPTMHPWQTEAAPENISRPHIDLAHNFDLDHVGGGVRSHRWGCDAAVQRGYGRACEDQWTSCTRRRHQCLHCAPAAEGRLSRWGGCCPTDCPGQTLTVPSGN